MEPVREKLANDLLVKLHTDPEKTKISNISTGELEFVGFKYTKTNVRARKSNVEKYEDQIKKPLRKEAYYKSDSYFWKPRLNIAMTYCINPRIIGIQEPENCDKCGLPKTGKRNWMAYFAQVVTDIGQFKGNLTGGCVARYVNTFETSIVYDLVGKN